MAFRVDHSHLHPWQLSLQELDPVHHGDSLRWTGGGPPVQLGFHQYSWASTMLDATYMGLCYLDARSRIWAPSSLAAHYFSICGCISGSPLADHY